MPPKLREPNWFAKWNNKCDNKLWDVFTVDLRLSHPDSKYIFKGPFTRKNLLTRNVCVCVNVLFLIFEGHKPFSWDHWYPCFGLLVMFALGFKAKVDPLVCVLHHLHAMDSSVSPLVRHLLTSSRLAWQPSLIDTQSYTHNQTLVGLEPKIKLWHCVCFLCFFLNVNVCVSTGWLKLIFCVYICVTFNRWRKHWR